MTEADDTKRRRGRPEKAKPDQEWLESEVRQTEALADWYASKGNDARAREARAAADALRAQAPTQYRSNRPLVEYESRHTVRLDTSTVEVRRVAEGGQVVELPWHVTGSIEERKRQALVDAIAAVDTLLKVMRAGLETTELQRKAEKACAVCEAYWRLDGPGPWPLPKDEAEKQKAGFIEREKQRQRFTAAVENLPAASLTEHRHTANVVRVVQSAARVHSGTIRLVLREAAERQREIDRKHREAVQRERKKRRPGTKP